jgi:hypothetical protein
LNGKEGEAIGASRNEPFELNRAGIANEGRCCGSFRLDGLETRAAWLLDIDDAAEIRFVPVAVPNCGLLLLCAARDVRGLVSAV